jgi:glycosyltransferase involved in cell wall biosynthesis
MRVLVVNQVFYPDVAATAQHAHDLARHLVARGHEVTVIASRSIYGQRGASMPGRETVDGIEIRRVGRSFFGKAGIVGRALDFGLFLLAAVGRSLLVPRPDVVVCLTTPPFIALVGVLLQLARRSRFVYWVMDLYPDVPIACGVMRAGSLASRGFEAISRCCLRRADRVVVLGRCMERRVLDKGIDAERIARIGVWADPEEIAPIDPAASPYRREWGADGGTVVMYSGNFGLAHDMATICGAMAALKDEPRIRFVLVGGGKGLRGVEAFVDRSGLQNVLFLPYQPRARLADLLGAADVHLASMRPGLEGLIVPSKLFGIMAAARPVVFIGPSDSEIAMVLDAERCGVTVAQGDVAGLATAIRSLVDEPRKARSMGERGRRALEADCSRQIRCEAWLGLLEQLAPSGHSRRTTPTTACPEPLDKPTRAAGAGRADA